VATSLHWLKRKGSTLGHAEVATPQHARLRRSGHTVRPKNIASKKKLTERIC
jgi:hypothetical protein